jgi:competence protein ComEA
MATDDGTGVTDATLRTGTDGDRLRMNDVVVRGGPRARLEEVLGRRVDTGVVVALVGVLVVGGLLVWARRPAAAVAPPATPPPAAASLSAAPELLVHVAGAVREPGLYALPPGARVADAIEAAGGATARADLDLLNLAEPLSDGAKVDVLARGATAPPASSAAGVATGPIPLNSADQASLETIPGVGPVTAAAILAYRDEAGSFTSIEQLMEVSGIGPATLESMRPYVTL